MKVERPARPQCEYGLEFLATYSFVKIPGPEPLQDKFEHLIARVCQQQVIREALHRCLYEPLEIQLKRLFHEYSENPDGRASQSERIFGAGRRLPDAEQTHHRVEFIGHGQNGPCLRGRQIIAGKTRLVLLVDCLRDFGRLSVIGRIVRTHKPLQISKLTYHAG